MVSTVFGSLFENMIDITKDVVSGLSVFLLKVFCMFSFNLCFHIIVKDTLESHFD